MYKSEILDSGLSDLEVCGNYFTYNSWVKIIHHYTDGTSKENTIVIEENIYMSEHYVGDNWSYKFLPNTNVSFIGYSLDEFVDDTKQKKFLKVSNMISRSDYDDATLIQKYINSVNKKDILTASFTQDITLHTAIERPLTTYYDYVTEFDMPSYKYEVLNEFKSSIKLLDDNWLTDGMVVKHHRMKFYITLGCSSLKNEYSYTLVINTPK